MKYYETDEVKGFSEGKPFGAWIGNLGKYNEGELVGEWVRFPTTPEELANVFKEIGIGTTDEFGQPYEEWFIADYDCYVKGMSQYLGEYENLDELNYLACRIEDMADFEYEDFLAAIELGDGIQGVKDLINVTYDMDSYAVIHDAFNDHDLGYYWVVESGAYDLTKMDNLANYIDYESFGRDVRLEEGGIFTEAGYVSNRGGSLTEHYSGQVKDIPDEYRVFKDTGNYLENAEMQLEDDYGMIDGIINNAPKESVKDKLKGAEEKCKAQEIKPKEKINTKEEVSL